MKKFAGSFLLYSLGILVLLALSGCGSGYTGRTQAASTSSFGTDPVTGVAYVGASVCINCHETINIPGTGISNTVVFSFLKGEHMIHSGHNNSDSTTPQTLPSGQTGTCLTCHDPVGAPGNPDGPTIQSLITFTSATQPAEGGLAAVTCEACHGAGGQHYGTGPIPNPTPDWTACGDVTTGSCHAGPVIGHLGFHPENFPVADSSMPRPSYATNPANVPAGRTSILTAFENAANSHINSIKSPNYVTGSTTDVQALCGKCHTDEGAQQYKYTNGDSGQLDAAFPGSTPPVANASPVQCRTCHDPHNNTGETSGTGTLWGNAGLLLNGTTVSGQQWSGQFRTCNNCHQLVNPNDGTWLVGTTNDSSGNLEVGHHDIAVNSHGRVGVLGDTTTPDYFQTPAYTHYDIPTLDASTVTGYIVNTTDTHNHSAAPSGNNNGGACLDCHNPHNPDLTINNEWAQSPHAGFILQAKLNAYSTAKAAGDTGAGISSAVHSAAASAPSFNGEQMNGGAVCWRCHTSTGFRDLANGAATGTYSPTAGEFTAQVGPDGKYEQVELVYCWACHTTDVGDLRNPGQFSTATMTDSNNNSTYVIPSGSSFPTGTDTKNPNGSYICINCHSGRTTGQYIQQDFTSTTIQGYAVGYAGGKPTFDSHHAQDAGILYRTVGYEFPGADYSNVSYYKHDEIGTTAGATAGEVPAGSSVEFDGNGPCVVCHMEGSASLPSHIFNATTFDGSITFPATTSFTTGATVGLVNGIITQNVCDKCHSGTHTMSADVLNTIESGYQASLSALQQQLANNGVKKGSTTAWTSMGELGAAFNMVTLQAMPWGFPHNRVYTKRLIFDSIDYMEHGNLTGTIDVSTDATGIAGLASTWESGASQAQWVADWFANDDTSTAEGGTATPATPTAVTRP